MLERHPGTKPVHPDEGSEGMCVAEWPIRLPKGNQRELPGKSPGF